MDQEIMGRAKPYEGEAPERWKLLGMSENRKYRFRYYETPEGEIFRTTQKLKGRREPKIRVREENGRSFARRDYKRRMYETW